MLPIRGLYECLEPPSLAGPAASLDRIVVVTPHSRGPSARHGAATIRHSRAKAALL